MDEREKKTTKRSRTESMEEIEDDGSTLAFGGFVCLEDLFKKRDVGVREGDCEIEPQECSKVQITDKWVLPLCIPVTLVCIF